MTNLALVAPDVVTDDDIVQDAITAAGHADEAEAEAGSPYRWRMADSYAALVERGWTQQQVAKRCAVDQSAVSRYLTCAREYAVPHNRPTFWQAYKGVPGAAGAHVGQNSGDNEWYTPAEYIAAARLVMGDIDLDPASTATANSIVLASRFFTEEDDGLAQDWAGRVWMNPPYARPLIDSFCAKLAETYAAGPVTEAIVLVNNATDTGWFHGLAEVAAAICFPRGRVKFWHPDKVTSPLQGQALVYLGENTEAFAAAFLNFGFTARL